MTDVLYLPDCREVLAGVYERIRQSEFRPGSDHVTQVTSCLTHGVYVLYCIERVVWS